MSYFLDSMVIRRPYHKQDAKNYYAMFCQVFTSMCVGTIVQEAAKEAPTPLQITQVKEREYEQNTKAYGYKLKINQYTCDKCQHVTSIDSYIDKSDTEHKCEKCSAPISNGVPTDFIQPFGLYISVPSLKAEGETHRIRVSDVSHESDILLPLYYGRFEVHSFGTHATIVVAYFNRKAYVAIPGMDMIMESYTAIVSKTYMTEAMYIISDGRTLNDHAFAYCNLGEYTYRKSGKNTFEEVRENYGLDINLVLETIFTNNDILLAPKDIRRIEDEIRRLSWYIPFITMKDIDGYLKQNKIPDGDIPKAKADITYHVETLKRYMEDRKQIHSQLNKTPNMDVKFFKIKAA